MEDEIDLTQYIKILWKYKLIIVGIPIIAAVVVFFIVRTFPPVYETSTTMEIGRWSDAADASIIEAPEQIKNKIENDVYGVIIREKMGIPERQFPRKGAGLSVENPKGTNLIIVKIKGAKTDLAKNVLEELNKVILEEHQKIIEAQKSLLLQDIERQEAKIRLLEEEKKNLENKVSALQKVLPFQDSAGSQFALFDTKEKLENKKLEIENMRLGILNLQKQLESIRPTSIVKPPYTSEIQIGPRPLFNAAIALVVAGFISLLSAFCLEWWKENKKHLL